MKVPACNNPPSPPPPTHTHAHKNIRKPTASSLANLDCADACRKLLFPVAFECKEHMMGGGAVTRYTFVLGATRDTGLSG